MDNNTIYLYGHIGDEYDECDEASVARKLANAEGDITVKINSMGGSVFSGHAIKNLLNEYKGKKNVVVEGIAASAASYIAVGAADTLHMKNGSLLMIHNAKSICVGDYQAFRKEADLLEKVNSQIADVYVSKSNRTKEDILASMDNETWFTPEEAKSYGFNVITDSDMACFENISKSDIELFNYKNLPNFLKSEIMNRKPTKRDVEHYLHNNGFSSREAKTIISKGYDKALENNDDQRDVEQETAEMAELEKALNNLKFI